MLLGLARGDDLDTLVRDAFEAHPKGNTFPGEVYLRLGAEVLTLSGADPEHPITQDGLLGDHLPEATFKGRQNAKFRFALLAAAARAGGLEADLLEEVAWWGTDDYFDYALCATVALIRAAAAHGGIPVAEMVARLAGRHGIDPSPKSAPQGHPSFGGSPGADAEQQMPGLRPLT
ncbi:MAG: hypothetical protein ACRD0J_03430 [Acidimicrobiales bacterium]